MTGLYLIRAQLKRNPSIAAIASLLLPDDAAGRAMAAHRLVWSLFAGNPDQRREFLWREDKAKTFYILSPLAPGPSEIFDAEVKEFAPNLAAGDHLQFSLRANATRAVKTLGSRGRGKRADVVMAELYGVEPLRRAEARPEIITRTGIAWLAAQGETRGFTLAGPVTVDGYEPLKIPRTSGNRIEFSMLDFDGVLKVTDPEQFKVALARGFGHAKAFGCGLMLIRRAR